MQKDTIALAGVLTLALAVNVVLYVGAFAYANLWCIGYVAFQLVLTLHLALRLRDEAHAENAETSIDAH